PTAFECPAPFCLCGRASLGHLSNYANKLIPFNNNTTTALVAWHQRASSWTHGLGKDAPRAILLTGAIKQRIRTSGEGRVRMTNRKSAQRLRRWVIEWGAAS